MRRPARSDPAPASATNCRRLPGLSRGHGIVGTVAAAGVGEIVNDVDADPRRDHGTPTCERSSARR